MSVCTALIATAARATKTSKPPREHGIYSYKALPTNWGVKLSLSVPRGRHTTLNLANATALEPHHGGTKVASIQEANPTELLLQTCSVGNAAATLPHSSWALESADCKGNHFLSGEKEVSCPGHELNQGNRTMTDQTRLGAEQQPFISASTSFPVTTGVNTDILNVFFLFCAATGPKGKGTI